MGRWIAIWAVAFVALCFFRGGVLTSPPYDDHAVGIWNEAQYLRSHQFDYWKLRYEEKNWMDGGGVRSYMISVLPTLLALLMSVSPAPSVSIVVAHLFVFACASLLFTQMIAVLRSRVGFVTSVLAGLAALTTPVFLVQTQMIGMEVIMTAAGMTGFVLLVKGRPISASLFFLLSFFVKASGEVFTLAAIVFLVLHLIGKRSPIASMSNWTAFAGLVVTSLTLAVELAAGFWADDPAILLKDFHWPAVLKLPGAIWWAPEVAAIWIASLALAGIALLVWVKRRKREPQRDLSWRGILGQLVDEHSPAVFAFIFVSGMTAALASYVVFPRYAAPAIPFVYLLLAMSTTTLHVPRVLLASLLAAIVAVNLVNHDGKWYLPSDQVADDEFAYWTWWHPRMGVLTERSEEYFQDHFSVVEAVRLLESKYSEHPIMAEGLYASYMTQPAYGYVRQALPNVYPLTGYETAINGFVDFMLPVIEGKSDNFPILVWSGKSRTMLPPPGPYAEVLFDDGHPILPLVLYRIKPEGLPRSRLALEEWYLDHTWGSEWQAMRFLERYSYLRDTGRKERMLAHIDEAQKSVPPDDRLGFGQTLKDLRATVAAMPEKEEISPRAADKSSGAPLPAYELIVRDGAVARLEPTDVAGWSKVDVQEVSPNRSKYSIQVLGPMVSIAKGRKYELSVPVSTDAQREILVAITGTTPPYSNRGLDWTQQLAPGREILRLPFSATEDDAKARIVISLGASEHDIEIGAVELREAAP